MNWQNRRGQALPMLLIWIPILLSFWAITLKEGLTTFEKIKLQKNIDQAALLWSKDHARALNVIAALNEGLQIVQKRVHLMHATWMSLTACSAFNPACAKALSRLAPKLEPFYRKSENLAKTLASQQNEEKAWAEKTKQPLLGFLKTLEPSYRYFAYTEQGDDFVLPIRRGVRMLPDPIADIPAPMEWIENPKRQVGIAAQRSLRFAIPPAPTTHLSLWGLSESVSQGVHLDRMRFSGALSRLKAYRSFWIEQQGDLRNIGMPSLGEFEHDLMH